MSKRLNEQAQFIYDELDTYLESTTQLFWPGDVADALRAMAETFDELEDIVTEDMVVDEEFDNIVRGLE